MPDDPVPRCYSCASAVFLHARPRVPLGIAAFPAPSVISRAEHLSKTRAHRAARLMGMFEGGEGHLAVCIGDRAAYKTVIARFDRTSQYAAAGDDGRSDALVARRMRGATRYPCLSADGFREELNPSYALSSPGIAVRWTAALPLAFDRASQYCGGQSIWPRRQRHSPALHRAAAAYRVARASRALTTIDDARARPRMPPAPMAAYGRLPRPRRQATKPKGKETSAERSIDDQGQGLSGRDLRASDPACAG